MIDFLGIGAQKCGTIWLYEHLKTTRRSAFQQEKRSTSGIASASLVSWWIDLFPYDPGLRRGEITPAYARLDTNAIAAVKAAAHRLSYSIACGIR